VRTRKIAPFPVLEFRARPLMIQSMPKTARSIASRAGSFVHFALRHLRAQTFLRSRQVAKTGYDLRERVIPDYNFIYLYRGRAVWVVDGVDRPLGSSGYPIDFR